MPPWDSFYQQPPSINLDQPHASKPATMPQILDHLHTYTHSLPHPLHHTNIHHTHTPPVDIRETDNDYYFDIEVPGLSDRASVSIQWTSSRTLVVEGTVSRPDVQRDGDGAVLREPDTDTLREAYDLEQGGGEDNDDVGAAKKPAAAATANGSGGEVGAREVHVVLGERVIGHFKRDFCFPVDVDRKGLRAVLAAGVLSVKTPKVVAEPFLQKVQIRVE